VIEMSEIERALGRIEGKLDEISKKIDRINGMVRNHEQRISRVEGGISTLYKFIALLLSAIPILLYIIL